MFKKIIHIPVFIALLFLTFMMHLTSCSKNNDQVADNNSTINDYSGNWKISLFFDNGDETANFSGYIFTFSPTGTITATNGSNSVTGTWSSGSSKLIIDFGTTVEFEELNDDWLIVEKTANSIKLKDDNPAQTDRLEFVKL